MTPNEVASPRGFKINQLSYLLDWGLERVATNAPVDSFIWRWWLLNYSSTILLGTTSFLSLYLNITVASQISIVYQPMPQTA